MKRIIAMLVLLTLCVSAVSASADLYTGQIVTFGHYPQSSTGSDNSDIRWIVLEVYNSGNTALLISESVLECVPYNSSKTKVRWDSCTLRTWLNNSFVGRAFSSSERAALVMNGSSDYVTILPKNEAETYFQNDMARSAFATSYVLAQGVYTNDNGKCPWWLRNGNYADVSWAVINAGSFKDYSVNNSRIGVRPVINVDLNSVGF